MYAVNLSSLIQWMKQLNSCSSKKGYYCVYDTNSIALIPAV